MAGLRGIVGGELHEYTKLLAESREQALDRMIEDAETLGADAVVGVSFSTSVMSQGTAELMAFWYSSCYRRKLIYKSLSSLQQMTKVILQRHTSVS